jgi:imidazolonepropionase-like amidohydrolase
LRPAGFTAADGAAVVEVAGQSLLPGLINMHAHLRVSRVSGSQALPDEPPEIQLLRGVRNALVPLASGATTLRDAGLQRVRCRTGGRTDEESSFVLWSVFLDITTFFLYDQRIPR